MATFIFWNELGHPLKPMINTFVLPTFVLAIAKTHPCVKSISIKYRVNKIKQKLNENFFQNTHMNQPLTQTIF